MSYICFLLFWCLFNNQDASVHSTKLGQTMKTKLKAIANTATNSLVPIMDSALTILHPGIDPLHSGIIAAVAAAVIIKCATSVLDITKRWWRNDKVQDDTGSNDC